MSRELQCYLERPSGQTSPSRPPPLPTLTMHDPLDDVWTAAEVDPLASTDGWVSRWSVETRNRILRDELEEWSLRARLQEYAEAVSPYLGKHITDLCVASEHEYQKLALGVRSGFRFRPGWLYRAHEVEPLLPDGILECFCTLDNFYIPGEVVIHQIRRLGAWETENQLFFVIEIARKRAVRAIINPKRSAASQVPKVSDLSSTYRSFESSLQ